jgi:DNA-binding GntR family transcriptional regulator
MNSQPPHRTLRSWVYETLRERIIAGELAPGEALVEAQLAQDMGISRSPIREALRQLGQDGLVVTQPNSATIVSTMDEFDIDQVFEIRDLLESCLIAHAAIARTDAELAECAIILAQMPGVAETEDVRRYAELDVQFHSALWKMAKRPMVTETLLPIANQARRYLSLSSRTLHSESADTLLASYQEHVSMFAAIRDCNVAEAVTVTRIHMSSSRKRILQNMEVRRGESTEKNSHRKVQPLAYTITWTEGEL